jgi:hypothetical protein
MIGRTRPDAQGPSLLPVFAATQLWKADCSNRIVSTEAQWRLFVPMPNTLENATPVTRRRALATFAVLTATLLLDSCGSDGSTTTSSLSSDASLSALQIDSGTLTPAFAAATLAYTASVSNGTPFEIVRPTTANSGAKVTVNGVAVASGTASGGINLVVGPNTITVVVTAENQQTTRTYTIVVTRAA